MKTELESQDIQMIATTVVALLKPLLKSHSKVEDDRIFDAQGLVEYLKVDKSWIDRQIQLKNIPYFKCGKYNRFKKSAIDKWIESETIRPLQPLQVLKRSA